MKRVLITPMDWGLGHATRCIPIAREFEARGCEVLIAGSGESLALLRKELPGNRFFSLPEYTPTYPVTSSMAAAMVKQIPRFMRVIRSEHLAVESLVTSESVDLIVSDNRYGCWSRQVQSVLVTHQSNVLMPQRFGFLSGMVRSITAGLINKFDQCWIPDFPASHSLAGALISFGQFSFKTPIEYVGWLSRFKARTQREEPVLDVVAILSGPEPQRSVFEEVLLPQLQSSDLRFRLVRGLPSAVDTPTDGRVVNALTSSALQGLIESAGIIVARSGYSTVMDMQALGKRAIFVPTPGQTEQEYLARVLQERKIAFSTSQKTFDLANAIRESKRYHGFAAIEDSPLLSKAVAKLFA